MKRLASAMLGLLLLGLWLPRVANVADVDWLGRINLLGGAERQTHETKLDTGGGSHGLLQTELLSVIPITPIFGIQFQAGYANMFPHHKFAGQAGPIVSFGMGKAGLFITDQLQSLGKPAAGGGTRNANFVWLTPSVALYDLIPATNLDIWFSQQLSRHDTISAGEESDIHNKKNLAPTSSLRAALNFFPPWLPFGNGNTELTLGIQINGLSGMDKQNAPHVGVGPVVGAAFMPLPNLEVQLFKVSVDNRSHYQVLSGVQFYISPSGGTLLQERRKYLEPTNMPQQINTKLRL
jgi:hypothetical protein